MACWSVAANTAVGRGPSPNKEIAGSMPRIAWDDHMP